MRQSEQCRCCAHTCLTQCSLLEVQERACHADDCCQRYIWLLSVRAVQAVDQASKGLPFAKAQRVAFDVRAAAAALHMGGAPTPVATSAAVSVSGTAVLARLQTLPPQTEPLHLPVTQWQTVEVAVPRRGCRPPPKAYTDVAVKVAGLTLGIAAGLEPAVAALSKAARRITPPSAVLANGDAAPVDAGVSRLQWWDRLRYQWRGRGRLTLSDTCAVVSTAHAPTASAHDARAVIKLQQGEAVSDGDAQLRVHMTHVSADAHMPQHEGRSRPGSAGLRIPLLSLPSLRLALDVHIMLPGNRSVSQHHVFPPAFISEPDAASQRDSALGCPVSMRRRLSEERRQGPVDVAAAFAAEAFALSLTVQVRSTAHVRSCLAPACQYWLTRCEECCTCLLVP